LSFRGCEAVGGDKDHFLEHMATKIGLNFKTARNRPQKLLCGNTFIVKSNVSLKYHLEKTIEYRKKGKTNMDASRKSEELANHCDSLVFLISKIIVQKLMRSVLNNM